MLHIGALLAAGLVIGLIAVGDAGYTGAAAGFAAAGLVLAAYGLGTSPNPSEDFNGFTILVVPVGIGLAIVLAGAFLGRRSRASGRGERRADDTLHRGGRGGVGTVASGTIDVVSQAGQTIATVALPCAACALADVCIIAIRLAEDLSRRIRPSTATCWPLPSGNSPR